MPKLEAIIHSPSSVALAERCPRAWWLRYREGIKQPEFTWAQVCAHEAWKALAPAVRRRTPEPIAPVGGQRSTALGKEVHARAEIWLTRGRDRERKRLDWNDLPGLCLAELVRHLPEAGSLTRKQVEANVSVKAGGVSWRGVIDVATFVQTSAGRVLESYDHKTSGNIQDYALLPHAVAERQRKAWLAAVPARAQALLNPPARSLRDDLQACLYTLARASTEPDAAGSLCRWNYTETKRIRRSLPVVAWIPTAHALATVERASATARTVAALRTKQEAIPNTLACDDYGGCWYRREGHCKVPRKLGAVLLRSEAQATEKEAMKSSTPKRFKDLEADTLEANEAEERAARLSAKAKRKPAPVVDEDEAPESEPAPVKRKAKPAPPPVDEDDSEDEDEPEAPAPVRGRKPVPAETSHDKLGKARANLQIALGEFCIALETAAKG